MPRHDGFQFWTFTRGQTLTCHVSRNGEYLFSLGYDFTKSKIGSQADEAAKADLEFQARKLARSFLRAEKRKQS